MSKKGRHLLSYLAGLFDGEGCITLTRYKPEGQVIYSNYMVVVKVRMCNELVVRLFQQTFGGKVRHCKPKKSQWSETWEWYLTTPEFLPFLTDILPYLILKRPNAEIALYYLLHFKQKTNIPVSKDLAVLREAEFIRMRKLNKKGSHLLKELI